MDNVVLCKDCKHQFRAWYDILFVAKTKYSMRCRKAHKPAHDDIDLVIGPVHKAEHYEHCGIARIRDETCGVEGKLWEPKDPKKFLLYLKRI